MSFFSRWRSPTITEFPVLSISRSNILATQLGSPPQNFGGSLKIVRQTLAPGSFGPVSSVSLFSHCFSSRCYISIALASMDLSPDSISRLLLGQRLTGEVINAYFDLLQKRADHGEKPCIKTFDTFVWIAFKNFGFKAITDRLKNTDLSAIDLLLIPHHSIERQHWSLAVADLRSRAIIWFDSYFDDCVKGISDLRSILQQLFPKEDVTSWPAWMAASPKQPQKNYTDCGVYTCVFAEAVSRKAEIRLSPKQLRGLHLRITLKNQLFAERASSIALTPSKIRLACRTLYPPPSSSLARSVTTLRPNVLQRMRAYLNKYQDKAHPKPFFLKDHPTKRERLYPRDIIRILNSVTS
ncbi:hypothetical protein BC332_34673 [Capsicum chinense]|nr:hypothetical protein BC332_34673 [Capsicum chinense]